MSSESKVEQGQEKAPGKRAGMARSGGRAMWLHRVAHLDAGLQLGVVIEAIIYRSGGEDSGFKGFACLLVCWLIGLQGWESKAKQQQ